MGTCENTPEEPDNWNNHSHQQDIWNTYQCESIFLGFVFFRGMRTCDREEKAQRKEERNRLERMEKDMFLVAG